MAAAKKDAARATAKNNTKKATKKTAAKKTAAKKAPAKNVAAVKSRRRIGDVSRLHEPVMNVLENAKFAGAKGLLPGAVLNEVNARASCPDERATLQEVTKALGELAEKKRALKPLKRGAGAFWTAAPTTTAAA